MCKDCENNINKNEELEQENMSLEDLSKDELLDVCYELINQKEKQIDDLQPFNPSDFAKALFTNDNNEE